MVLDHWRRGVFAALGLSVSVTCLSLMTRVTHRVVGARITGRSTSDRKSSCQKCRVAVWKCAK